MIMGNSIFRRFFGQKEVRILIQGLDASGKTTTLYTLKLGEVVTTIPTIGFNVETLQFKNMAMTAWDVGGRDKIRPLYRHYYPNTQGVVFVIDSNDRERLDDALKELYTTVGEPELVDVPFLILANKQDLSGAMKPGEIEAKLMDEKLMRGKRWNVFGVSATNLKNNGLYEAFSWLADEMAGTEKNNLAASMMYGNEANGKKNNADKYVVEKTEKNAKYYYCSFVDSLKKMLW